MKRLLGIVLSFALLMSGCGKAEVHDINEFETGHYENVESYNVGNFTYDEEDVDAIEINWIVGDVDVRSSSNECKVVDEAKDLEEDYKMRWKIENRTLTIQYAKSDVKGKLGKDNLKNLSIEVPNGKTLHIKNDVGNVVAHHLSLFEYKVKCSVGNVEADHLKVQALDMSSEVGDIEIGLQRCEIGILRTDVGDINLSLLDHLGATVRYSTDVGKYNDKDNEGEDIIGDGSCHLQLIGDVGSFNVH